ncbi:MAG: prephenate dehydrogenase [Actinobacteria bacterium]|nr:prephenate dehydrogenase [Actinomycetota bacterium]
MPGHVAVVGLGLIGGSVARALAHLGREVVGFDADAGRIQAAADAGVIMRAGSSIGEAAAGAAIVFVAVPVGDIADVAVDALRAGAELVTDVGSVKAPVIRRVEAEAPELAPHFIGGHPMAGSEQEGLAGADPDMFRGTTWVLTPTEHTDPDAYARLRGVVRDLGAEVIAVPPDDHDSLVALVSHVPHLAAGTLMLVASRGSGSERGPLLRLAAGGFRDMTRIASGHPGIWPDICVENREAIVAALDRYLDALAEMRERVAAGDRSGLLTSLEEARHARTNLPIAGLERGPFVELRIPVPDRPGVLAEVTTLAGQIGVNIVDLEIAHSLEGQEGVLVMVVPETGAGDLEAALEKVGYRTSARPIE